MSDNVAARYATPSKSASTESDSYTPSNSSPSKKTSSVPKLSNNADTIGQSMGRHGLIFNDRKAFESYPEFHQKIMGIVNSGRCSEMGQQSVRRFEARLDIYHAMNEATLLQNLFPMLIKTGFHVTKANSSFTEVDKKMLEEDGKLYRDFVLDEGIVTTMDREFGRTLLPNKYDNPFFEAEIRAALAKEKGMTNPKPDYVHGTDRKRFPLPTDVPIPQEVTALLEIAPGMHNPFLLVERKADRGSPAEAKNQVRRGGRYSGQCFSNTSINVRGRAKY